jgi:P27 family predicted phage terminase small subunit
MTKGRLPDPNRAKRHTGHRPLTGQGKALEIMPVAGLELAPPESIPDDARETWSRACLELTNLGLREADLPLVEMLVIAAHRNRQARAIIATQDLLIGSPRGMVVNPMLKVEKETAATYLRLCETLGLSPAARARLGLMHIVGQSTLLDIAERVERVQRASRAK